MRFALVLSAATALAGCQAVTNSIVDPSMSSGADPMVLARNHASVISTIVSRWKAAPTPTCNSPDMIQAGESLEQIAFFAREKYRISIDPWQSEILRPMNRRNAAELAQLQITKQFQIADAFLARSCLDEADSLYRDVITTFLGGNYAAARQRAEIGIEDVRAARTR